MINIRRANIGNNTLVYFMALSPHVHDKLASLRDVLLWVFWIEIFCIDVDDHGLAISSMTYWTIYNKFVHSGLKICCVNEHIFLLGFISEVFEVLSCCVDNVDVRNLVIKAFIVEELLPVTYLLKNRC